MLHGNDLRHGMRRFRRSRTTRPAERVISDAPAQRAPRDESLPTLQNDAPRGTSHFRRSSATRPAGRAISDAPKWRAPRNEPFPTLQNHASRGTSHFRRSRTTRPASGRFGETQCRHGHLGQPWRRGLRHSHAPQPPRPIASLPPFNCFLSVEFFKIGAQRISRDYRTQLIENNKIKLYACSLARVCYPRNLPSVRLNRVA